MLTPLTAREVMQSSESKLTVFTPSSGVVTATSEKSAMDYRQ